jgi:dTDP-glucose pyrophosphorylase
VLQYGLDEKFHKWAPGSHLITLQGLTEGAACTVLSAKSLINDNNPLMIANADQYVDIDINEYLNALLKPHIDGMIMTMAAADPKWSFIKANSMGWVLEVAEKRVISHEATVGIYNFSRGRDFINSVELMISKNDRVNGEFYIAPSYNYMIHGGGKIGFYNIDKKGGGMHGLGTPEDLEKFIKHPSSSKIF